MNRAARWLSVFAALCCGLSVALGAYASHAAEGKARERIALAALFAFAHGLGLLVLARQERSRWLMAAMGCQAAGVILFSGSLVCAAFFAWSTVLAPAGGTLLIAGWFLVAVAICLRRDP